MKVPDTKATPRMIEIAVSMSLSLWPRTFLVAALNMTRSPTLRVEALHALEDHVSGRPGHLVHNLAVCEEEDAVGVRRGARVVGDDDDRLAVVVDRATQEVEDLDAGAGVQVAGGLVGEDDRGPADQGSGTRHALLLTTGELVGPVVQAVAQA